MLNRVEVSFLLGFQTRCQVKQLYIYISLPLADRSCEVKVPSVSTRATDNTTDDDV